MTDELRNYIEQRINAAMTCPRCDLETASGWCPLCGDEYPWPNRDTPFTPTTPHGIA